MNHSFPWLFPDSFKIPWLFPDFLIFFQNSPTGKSCLIFPGFPVPVGTLIFLLGFSLFDHFLVFSEVTDFKNNMAFMFITFLSHLLFYSKHWLASRGKGLISEICSISKERYFRGAYCFPRWTIKMEFYASLILIPLPPSWPGQGGRYLGVSPILTWVGGRYLGVPPPPSWPGRYLGVPLPHPDLGGGG